MSGPQIDSGSNRASKTAGLRRRERAGDNRRKQLDDTLTFIRDIDRAASPAEICGVILKAVRPYGFGNILAGTIPLPGATQSQQESNVVLADWPMDWAQRYFSSGYLFVDPAIRRVTSDVSPFMWSELAPFCRDDAMARRVMNEAGDFQLKCGFTVPLVTLEGEVAGFSIAGPRVEMPPSLRGMMSLVTAYAFGHALNLRVKRIEAANARITPREQEILQWAAAGKTEWEIGEILNISEHTVDKFFRSARSKLNATNRTQAVAEAFRRYIIT
ncbi:MAG TPA: LuxR family transcriptional regulator [Pseudolabrys sp.]|nr:LuxR family transcriptional regulator [Pseudolabrys sp.]